MKSYQLIALFISFSLLGCKNDHGHDHDHGAHHDHDKKEHQDQEKKEEIKKEHGHNHANHHMHKKPVEELIKSFDSEERALTQKPNEVIALFGDLKGKKVLDIGSGSGYFTFRMADKGAFVIAGDVDDEFHAHIRKEMEENELYAENIEIRKLPYDSPFLHSAEVDNVIIVNTYHHIENRIDYFNQVRVGLKNDGMLMIVDFMKKKFEEEVQGPPYEMRISKDVVIDELKQAGFGNFEVNEELLPYQYIIMIKK